MEQRRSRDRIFLSTKGAHPVLGQMHVGRLSRAEIRSDMQASLDDLRTDHADIYWLHRDDVSRPVGDIMETMQSLIDDGFTKLIGASNWMPARIREANAYAAAHGLTPFHANQPQFSLAKQMIVEDPTLTPMDDETYRMHLDTGMPCVAFSSQAKGFYSKLDALGESGLPDKAKRRFLHPENLAVYERMKAVREQTGLSVGAIALAWLTGQPFPVFPICGASSVEQVMALAEAGDATLTIAQRELIRPQRVYRKASDMPKGAITIRYMQEYLKRNQEYPELSKASCIELADGLNNLAGNLLHKAHCAATPDDLIDILYHTLSLANVKEIDLETWISAKEEPDGQQRILYDGHSPSHIKFNPEDESWFRSDNGMKPVRLSADSPITVFMVPEVVADNLRKYCLEFCDWLRDSPDAARYQVSTQHGIGLCFDHHDFIQYLNTYRFPDQPSYPVEDIPPVRQSSDLPSKYRTVPRFNF